MEEQRAVELLSRWDEIISPQDCDNLLFWISCWIDEIENALTLAEGVVAEKRLKLIEAGNSVAKANVYLEVELDYKIMKDSEKKLRRLKSARSNVKRRYEIITNKLLQNKRY